MTAGLGKARCYFARCYNLFLKGSESDLVTAGPGKAPQLSRFEGARNPPNINKNGACGSKVHFGHFLVDFCCFFLVRADVQNTVIYSVCATFAW